MNHDVLVVGGGIGGLTLGALLAARGFDVGVFERQARVGGCLSDFEHGGYTFESTTGLYSGLNPHEIFETIFSELSVAPPETHPLAPPCVVRLPDRTDVALVQEQGEFEDQLRRAFPECAENAILFYRELKSTSEAKRLTNTLLQKCSLRFVRFVDAQLQALAQCASDRLSVEQAARALKIPRQTRVLEGGAQALADTLAQSISKCGGRVRLNAPVLRLAYGANGNPIGIDLLSGETVLAGRAIVSNLTVWDTYGKLVGPGRTPPSVRSQIKDLKGWGVYLLFLGMDRIALERLKSTRMIVVTDWQENATFSPEQTEFVLAVSESASRAPDDKLAVTVTSWVDPEDWFSFHQDERAHEEKDQTVLEDLWRRLHKAFPELGGDVEVIETATPRFFYETTRRRFGMVGGVCGAAPAFSGPDACASIFPNLFLIGDTVSAGPGIQGVCEAAQRLADRIQSYPE